MILSTNTPSFSEEARTISDFLHQRLKPLGYKKRRNGFNRRLDNGLIHQLSIFSVGAYSNDHGKFYIHAGCHVPEVTLYRRYGTVSKWVTDAQCAIRGCFPDGYLSLRAAAANLDMLTPYIDDALEALSLFDSYDAVMGDITVAEQLAPKKSLWFEAPPPIIKACIQISREDAAEASRTIQRYLYAVKAADDPHLGHIGMVSEWAEEMGL